MVEIIDATSHIITHEVLDELERHVESDEIASLRNAPRMFEEEGRIDYLDRHGFDRQVINLAAPMIFHDAGPEASIEATRVANDEIKRIAEEYPDRFIPTGTVPFLTEEYVAEAKRCVNELELPGIQTFTNFEGKLLDHDDFEPFWKAMDELAVPVWLHPQLTDWHDYSQGKTWIYKMLGWPFDTSVAVARLLFDGTLERHRNVELVTHHLGGSLPFVVGRLHSWYRSRREEPELYANPEMADLSEPLSAYFERIYADTAVSSVGESYPLQCGYEFFGPDNIVFSVDYPFGPDRGEYWAQTIPRAIDDLDIPEEHKRQIYSGNIKRILDL